MTSPTSDTRALAGPSALSNRLLPAIAATLLGLVILYGAGFAPQAAVHNAAHDARHSAAFPCH